MQVEPMRTRRLSRAVLTGLLGAASLLWTTTSGNSHADAPPTVPCWETVLTTACQLCLQPLGYTWWQVVLDATVQANPSDPTLGARSVLH